MWPPEAFQACHTPRNYARLLLSYEIDPPLVDVLHATNALLSELLAVYYNVHRNPDTHEPFTGSDFLRDPDAVDDDEEAEEQEDVAPVHPMVARGSARTGVGLLRGHGEKVPESILALFSDGNDTDESS